MPPKKSKKPEPEETSQVEGFSDAALEQLVSVFANDSRKLINHTDAQTAELRAGLYELHKSVDKLKKDIVQKSVRFETPGKSLLDLNDGQPGFVAYPDLSKHQIGAADQRANGSDSYPEHDNLIKRTLKAAKNEVSTRKILESVVQTLCAGVIVFVLLRVAFYYLHPPVDNIELRKAFEDCKALQCFRKATFPDTFDASGDNAASGSTSHLAQPPTSGQDSSPTRDLRDLKARVAMCDAVKTPLKPTEYYVVETISVSKSGSDAV